MPLLGRVSCDSIRRLQVFAQSTQTCLNLLFSFYNVWNPMLALFCHADIGIFMEALAYEKISHSTFHLA